MIVLKLGVRSIGKTCEQRFCTFSLAFITTTGVICFLSRLTWRVDTWADPELLMLRCNRIFYPSFWGLSCTRSSGPLLGWWNIVCQRSGHFLVKANPLRIAYLLILRDQFDEMIWEQMKGKERIEKHTCWAREMLSDSRKTSSKWLEMKSWSMLLLIKISISNLTKPSHYSSLSYIFSNIPPTSNPIHHLYERLDHSHLSLPSEHFFTCSSHVHL